MESVLQNIIKERAEQTLIKENNIKPILINIVKIIAIFSIVFLLIYKERIMGMID